MEQIYFCLQLNAQSGMAGRSRQEPEAAAYITFTIMKQRDEYVSPFMQSWISAME